MEAPGGRPVGEAAKVAGRDWPAEAGVTGVVVCSDRSGDLLRQHANCATASNAGGRLQMDLRAEHHNGCASGSELMSGSQPAADRAGLTHERRSRSAYCELANLYEQRTVANEPWRRTLVDQLPLRPGDVVLDVGCGTGLCFPLLEAKVGDSDAIIGIDES